MSWERETCAHTKQTLSKYNYGYFQLKKFVGRGKFRLTPSSLHSFDEKQIGMLQVCRSIATKETISKIEECNDKYDADKEYLEDTFMEQIDYNLSTVQSNNYLQIYKSKAKNSIPYFLNKFVIPIFVLSE